MKKKHALEVMKEFNVAVTNYEHYYHGDYCFYDTDVGEYFYYDADRDVVEPIAVALDYEDGYEVYWAANVDQHICSRLNQIEDTVRPSVDKNDEGRMEKLIAELEATVSRGSENASKGSENARQTVADRGAYEDATSIRKEEPKFQGTPIKLSEVAVKNKAYGPGNGTCGFNSPDACFGLDPALYEVMKVEVWVNVYRDYCTYHDSKSEAMKMGFRDSECLVKGAKIWGVVDVPVEGSKSTKGSEPK